MNKRSELAAKILDTAVALAERRSWESIRLHEVADQAGLTLEEIRQHFREKEELVAAWLDRADAAMLRRASSPGIAPRPTRERLEGVILSWLDHLEPHRRVTRQMIWGQCEPGHLHVQIRAVLRISRTVQWMREAAGLKDTGIQRALAETVLSGIFVTTFVYWLRDDSAGSARTRDLLGHLLDKAERLALRTPGFAAGHEPRESPVVTAEAPSAPKP